MKNVLIILFAILLPYSSYAAICDLEADLTIPQGSIVSANGRYTDPKIISVEDIHYRTARQNATEVALKEHSTGVIQKNPFESVDIPSPGIEVKPFGINVERIRYDDGQHKIVISIIANPANRRNRFPTRVLDLRFFGGYSEPWTFTFPQGNMVESYADGVFRRTYSRADGTVDYSEVHFDKNLNVTAVKLQFDSANDRNSVIINPNHSRSFTLDFNAYISKD